jgi:hypothetical protein
MARRVVSPYVGTDQLTEGKSNDLPSSCLWYPDTGPLKWNNLNEEARD